MTATKLPNSHESRPNSPVNHAAIGRDLHPDFHNNKIILRNVMKQFPTQSTPAISSLNITISPGYVTGLVGPDGAGKTTLMRMLAGLLVPTQGDISVAGFDPVRQQAQLRQVIGYMPQKFGLYEDLTVQENLDLFANLHGITGEKRQQTMAKLLKFTDLARFTPRLAGKLSGGMKQKLGLACTLLSEPKVLLLDEPGVGVDPISRIELWEMVHTLANEGMLIVWSTSYLDEAERCPDLILLNEGHVLFTGAPKALTERVDGRSILISAPIPHRQLLQKALLLPAVTDGVLQGQYVRLILRQGAQIESSLAPLTAIGTTFSPVPARFEDAFIDLLGGIQVRESVLAKVMPALDVNLDEVVIEAQSLTKKFGDFTATDHVNFAVKRGEIFGLLGPNGAGKSTTFKMMCGLLTPTSGDARVLGLNFKTSSMAVRQHLGYMAQKFSLYGNITVAENLRFFSGIYGLKGTIQQTRIDEMIAVFDFQPILHQLPGSLPLGFKQRLALACALMHRPDIIFLDEPTSGVDPITRREFWLHINSMVDKGVTVLVTTHFMEEAEYCDRIGLVYQGKMIALDKPDALKQQIATSERPNPTMEDVFIETIQHYTLQQDKGT